MISEIVTIHHGDTDLPAEPWQAGITEFSFSNCFTSNRKESGHNLANWFMACNTNIFLNNHLCLFLCSLCLRGFLVFYFF